MKQVVEIKNRTLSELTVEEGVIETLRRLKCDEKLSFIDYKVVTEKSYIEDGKIVKC